MTDQDEQLSLNDVTDYGLCFACGPRNPYGLKLHMERDGNRVVTKFTTLEEYQGYPGYLHGGIITALLDEVMSRVSIVTHNRWSITGRDRRALPQAGVHRAGGDRRCRARRNEPPHGHRESRTAPPRRHAAAARATGRFFFVPEERLAEMTSDYPALAPRLDATARGFVRNVS